MFKYPSDLFNFIESTMPMVSKYIRIDKIMNKRQIILIYITNMQQA